MHICNCSSIQWRFHAVHFSACCYTQIPEIWWNKLRQQLLCTYEIFTSSVDETWGSANTIVLFGEGIAVCSEETGVRKLREAQAWAESSCRMYVLQKSQVSLQLREYGFSGWNVIPKGCIWYHFDPIWTTFLVWIEKYRDRHEHTFTGALTHCSTFTGALTHCSLKFYFT